MKIFSNPLIRVVSAFLFVALLSLSIHSFRSNISSAPDFPIAYNRGPDGNTSWSVSKTKLDRLKIHASEYSSIGLKYDYIVENNNTIDELHAKIYEIINSQSQGLPVSK